MLDFEKIKQSAKGKAYSILANMGIEVPDDPKQHSGCPICGSGKNNHRFRFSNEDGRGTWHCNQCGHGDLYSLIMMSLGIDFVECMRRLADILGEVEQDEAKEDTRLDEDRTRQLLNELWKEAVPIKPGDLVTKYLINRKMVLTPHDVRFCAKCYEAETKMFIPAMLALVKGIDGKPITIHRTYLTEDGKKADIKAPKKTMPCVGRLRQAAIRLFPPKDDLIGVAEGIETAISATQIFGIPTWSVVNTSVMESFFPPEGIRRVVVFGDNDANFAGAKSAYTLANRLYAKDLIVEVNLPGLADWNDELVAAAKRAA